MSASSGPSLVDDGLVFGYDMGNPQKSWKGAPTTNLITSTGIDCSVLGGYTSLTVTRVADEESPSGYAMRQQVAVSGINGASRATMGSSDNIPTSGQTYVSIYVRRANSTTNIIPYVFTGGGWYSLSPLDGGSVYLTSEYRRFGALCNMSTSSGGPNPAFSMTQSGSTTDTNVITEWHSPQCEQKSFATPFVNGTRTDYQALLDITKQSNIQSVFTYDSDGSFSFDSSNYGRVVPQGGLLPLKTNNPSTITVEAWVYYTSYSGGTAPHSVITSWGSIGNNSLWVLENPSNTLTFGFTAGGAHVNIADTSVHPLNTWIHVAGTYDGASKNIYVNGVLKNSSPQTGGPPFISRSVYPLIGSYSYDTTQRMNGKISMVKVHNRALSASEVQQNFNAMRTRYGI